MTDTTTAGPFGPSLPCSRNAPAVAAPPPTADLGCGLPGLPIGKHQPPTLHTARATGLHQPLGRPVHVLDAPLPVHHRHPLRHMLQGRQTQRRMLRQRGHAGAQHRRTLDVGG